MEEVASGGSNDILTHLSQVIDVGGDFPVQAHVLRAIRMRSIYQQFNPKLVAPTPSASSVKALPSKVESSWSWWLTALSWSR